MSQDTIFTATLIISAVSFAGLLLTVAYRAGLIVGHRLTCSDLGKKPWR